MLVDIGVNLAAKIFDNDVDVVINDAFSVGVQKMIITGSCPDSNHKAHILTHKKPNQLYHTAGTHPHYACNFKDQDLLMVKKLSKSLSFVAIGECGLDYFRNLSPKKDQIYCFYKYLDLACETQLPLFLHLRDAFSDFYKIITEFKADLPKFVVHCWTGTKDELTELLKIGAYIGITGWICDDKRGAHLHEQLKIIPDTHLMIETDSPYLTPKTLNKKTKRNVPANLVFIAEYIAKIKGISFVDFCNNSSKVAFDFFNLDKKISDKKERFSPFF
jgi:TatD DNase family protein